MKTNKLTRFFFAGPFILLPLFSVLWMGCKHHHQVDDPLIKLHKQLVADWKVTSVTLDGVDVTTYYKNLVLTWGDDKSYSCSNAVDPLWPATGSYENKLENNQLVITRSDNLRLVVSVLDDSQMVLQFSWEGKAPGGRVSSLMGNYEFTFNK